MVKLGCRLVSLGVVILRMRLFVLCNRFVVNVMFWFSWSFLVSEWVILVMFRLWC